MLVPDKISIRCMGMNWERIRPINPAEPSRIIAFRTSNGNDFAAVVDQYGIAGKLACKHGIPEEHLVTDCS